MKRRSFLKVGVCAAALLPAVITHANPSKLISPEKSLKLGKRPATPGAVKLKLNDYLNQEKLPTPPQDFGHQGAVSDWGMLGNDNAGDCVWAGAAHEHMLFTTLGGCQADFNDQTVLKVYSDVTKYDPKQTMPGGYNPTDQGTDVPVALKYRQQTGITDLHGNVHKIGAYVAIAPQDLTTIATAAYLFSAVAIGVMLPAYAMDQYFANEPWDIPNHVTNTGMDGGHYIPIIGRKNGNFVCITWGKEQQITPRFLYSYCDEAYAIFSTEYLKGGKSPEGFDNDQLLKDLQAVTA